MKKKLMIIIAVVAVVCLSAGMTYAIWSFKPTALTFTIDAENYSTVVIKDVIIKENKLKPKDGEHEAVAVETTFNLDVKSVPADIDFLITDIQVKIGDVWENASQEVLSILVYDNNKPVLSLKNVAVGLRKGLVVKTQFVQDMLIIDPIYKNAEFKFILQINVKKVE